MRLLCVLVVGITLAGCVTPSVRTNFTAFHTLTPADIVKSVAVVPGNEGLEGSLEFATFKAKLEQNLRQVGFIVVNEPADADYVAFFGYGIDGGRTTTRTGSTPIYGQTGGGTTYHSGTLSSYGSGGYSGSGSYYGSSYTMPTYGIVGSETYTYNVTTYTRVVQLELLDRRALETRKVEKVYEVTLTSKGTCGQIAGVMDEILDGLFKDFPGESGKVVTVAVPSLGPRCGP